MKRIVEIVGRQGKGKVEVEEEVGVDELEEIVRSIVGEKNQQQTYSFFYNNIQIKTTLLQLLKHLPLPPSSQTPLEIHYHPNSLFSVSPITRSSSSLYGHTQPILTLAFSPDSSILASGSGDRSIRLWDVETEMPIKVLDGFQGWVMGVTWSGDGEYIAGGDANGNLIVYLRNGTKLFKHKPHKSYLISLSFQPLFLSSQSITLATAGKDTTIHLYSIPSGTHLLTIGAHTKSITKIIWGGNGLLYSVSEDQKIRSWNKKGERVMQYDKHAHWVNSIALSTEFVLKKGCFNQKPSKPSTLKQRISLSKSFYLKYTQLKPQRLVTCSDDNTLKLFNCLQKTPIQTMVGHSKPINHVQFSPDSHYMVSASFDKSLKLWNGYTGQYLYTLKGHVSAVYMVAFSPDSRYLVSASKDTTMHIWEVKSRKVMFELPGHADQVYAVEWSADGKRVGSGGKDKQVKMWKN